MDDTSLVMTDTSAASTDAPATDTIAQTQTESPRPSSFGEAVERLKAQDEAASTDREPATTAQEPPTKDTPPSKKGPIPFEVHEKALTNARSKAVEEAKSQIEQEVRSRYAWTESIEEPDRAELMALYHGLKTDLIGTLTTLIDNASQHPTHAQALRSQAARLLNAARRVQGEASQDDEPPPDIPLEDGRAVYSAEQLRKRDDWRERRLVSQFDQKLQPFQQAQARQAEEGRWQATLQSAREQLVEWRHEPHFQALEPDIKALMTEHPTWSVERAYAKVLTTKVLPTASQQGRTDMLADIHRKAGAGTLNPQQTTTATPFKADGKFTVERIAQFLEAGT